MSNELKPYLDLVDFLAEFLGLNTEIVLHDISNLEHSIVAIRNNFISGRKIGDTVTDFVLQILTINQYSDERFLCNYKTISQSGKFLKSATFFIKNFHSKIIAMLCMNMDLSCYSELRDHLDELLNFNKTSVTKTEEKEALIRYMK
ncbi:MAG: PAS domain-containing protein [Peptostreptococcaceae bacterium]|nr:PAS domain-containing protein [Peptostreptococcaceae bacterium]